MTTTVEPEKCVLDDFTQTASVLARAKHDVIEKGAEHSINGLDVVDPYDKRATYWHCGAERPCARMGSWWFICVFVGVLIGGMLCHTAVLAPRQTQTGVDPRIFLDVIVLLAAKIQAPSLMVSPNRSARKRQLAGWPDRRVDGRAKRKRGPALALRQQETRNNVAPIGVLGKSEGE